MTKKIGIVCYPTVGGSGVVATELGIHLAEKNYEVHFISTTMPFRLKRLYPNIYFHEVDVSNYPVFKHPPYDLSLASKISEVIDREELDIIHAHYAVPHAICSIFASQMAKRDVKIVTTLHGTDITILGIDDNFNHMIRYAIEQSDQVTAVSESLKKQTEEAFQIQKPIKVVYNFIDNVEERELSCSDLKSKLGISSNEKVLIHISNFRQVKRVEDVVRVFEQTFKRVESKLLLVGDGPEHSKVRNLVNELNLDEQVIFLGRQDNVHDLLKISDLKLLLSEKESFGLVLLEAMISGVPCIGTNIGGIPEVIEDGQNGYICEVGNINGISDKAVKLLTDDNLWQKFSSHAKQYAENNFSSDRIVRKYEEIYDQLHSQV
ncbi:N-acetyl-alpha-D-glucosaminyl L-malate synthase BshA [Filobacillus milosensis]|uniref:N-acetyl-alpha-D-glucosaminyl L-malate synthase BshA n=1 Tax=Filobacillus milosensis TaxID=94137 RepID=A0A4Y8IQN0_9BACI|nr:N-acetyl-alpha-D-glucosaminyl L-malate synthase BshA [Filobacillus milosensis]TFB23982.1 N-acetyl-alpha-D-glucosaminyl L-malate synthase BshA [Filobacillus milosensis]